MRGLVLAVLLVACKREQPSVKADPTPQKKKSAEIVIHRTIPRVGTRSQVVNKQHTQMDISGFPTGLDGGTGVEISLEDKRTEEVLAVDGKTVRKVRVTYDAHTTSTDVPFGTPTKTTSPVVGHTYVVDATKGATDITDTKGKTPPFNELEVVKRDYDEVGEDDLLSAALPDTPVHVGDTAPALAEAFKANLIRKSKMKLTGDVTARVDKVNNDEVTFAFSGKVSLEEGAAMNMTIPLDGKLVVRTSDGWPLEYSVGGPLTFGSDAGLSGKGSISLSAKRTYF
jgi:hypothetical protein